MGLDDLQEDNIIVIDPENEITLPGQITIKAFDANHCPGAVMFLFTVNGRKYLHTGDFRYCSKHDDYPELFEGIETLYVDATFKSEENRYNHPSQEEAIDQIISLINENPEKNVFIGLYQIGKNRIIQAIFERLGVRVYVTEERRHVYSLMSMDHAVTTDPEESRIKGYSMNYFYRNFKLKYPDYKKDSIVIIPTGWSRDRESNNGFYYIPYSEHNSSDELKRFIQKVKPLHIVETNV